MDYSHTIPNNDTHQPDFPSEKDLRTRRRKWPLNLNPRTYLQENVCDDTLVEVELLLLAFATGIQDAATYPDYLCFASNQTGNTVLLAVSAARLAPAEGSMPNVANTLMSLGMFIAGALIFGQIGNLLGCRRRSWLLLSNFLQTAMVFAATALQYAYPILVEGGHALAVIALLAFASGGQVAMARGLKITEITTAMATAVCSIISANDGLHWTDSFSGVCRFIYRPESISKG